jgi:hypothetical protein
LAKTRFDLRDKAQPLDGVLDRGLFWQGPKRLDGSLLFSDFRVYDFTVVELSSCLPSAQRAAHLQHARVRMESRARGARERGRCCQVQRRVMQRLPGRSESRSDFRQDLPR